jgi:hypothetical protein
MNVCMRVCVCKYDISKKGKLRKKGINLLLLLLLLLLVLTRLGLEAHKIEYDDDNNKIKTTRGDEKFI